MFQFFFSSHCGYTKIHALPNSDRPDRFLWQQESDLLNLGKKPLSCCVPAVVVRVGHVEVLGRVGFLGSVQSFGRYITGLVVSVAHDAVHEARAGAGAAGEARVPVGAVGQAGERLVPPGHAQRPVIRRVDGEPGRSLR